jgi:hypothetical protein
MVWYLLRVSPGGNPVVRLRTLPIPVSQVPAGAALSPDGTELAVTTLASPSTLRVYSASGALLHSWSAAGAISVEKLLPGSVQFPAMALRWSADGRQLGFAWNAAAIRVLSVSAPDGNLITRSKQLASIGVDDWVTDATFTCNAAEGWQLVQDGQGIICAGSAQSDMPHECPSSGKCGYVPNPVSAGFMRQTSDGQGGTETELVGGELISAATAGGVSSYLGWANTDGTVIIGARVKDGKYQFGIFRGSEFTVLPILLPSLPTPAGLMNGTVFW